MSSPAGARPAEISSADLLGWRHVLEMRSVGQVLACMKARPSASEINPYSGEHSITQGTVEADLVKTRNQRVLQSRCTPSDPGVPMTNQTGDDTSAKVF
jgi:hypothetical protein